MLTRATLLHLRIPFSFFLMPVYFFAIAVAAVPRIPEALWAFLILHLLVYPASNGYNSYYDKDEGSIGGLEHPPQVSKQLLYTAQVMDALAIALAIIMVDWRFGVGVLIYILVSRAYSYDKIRLKKYPLASWLVIGLFQGAWIILIVAQAVGKYSLSDLLWYSPRVTGAAVLSCWMLWASYPMTQVYQHDEDARRGDLTISRLLGIRGTFAFVGLGLGLVGLAFVAYFIRYYHWHVALLFVGFMSPLLGYYAYWFRAVIADAAAANYKSAMRFNLLSGLCMNLFFFVLVVWRHL
ncbi:UbiA family prenyltransferase [Eisenibacter elegans]|jgi:1,4-dihydroxy-2-naphthoate octaprenyltransferase|uniref:UbiA family prenyltransferase n=1 Tax=Eisenibacter elegans TaxID=997 RepID=UPI0004125754|nr:UbiA family prenyltransferase [Eisenibacter elegans]